MEERTGVIRSYVEGPRWAAFPKFLRDMCFVMDLQLELEVTKGFIRETVRYKVEGPESKLRKFARDLESSLEAYNT